MIKISDFPRTTQLDGNELVPIVTVSQDGSKDNATITVSDLASEITEPLETQVNSLEDNVSELETQVNSLDGRVNTLENTNGETNGGFNGYLLSSFSDFVNDGDWTPAVHEAIAVANENRSYVVVDGMYDIKTQITIPTNTTIQGHGFTYGVCGFNLVTSGITAVEIRGVAITFKNLVIKTTRTDTETHGLVFSSSNLPDTNLYHAFCNIRDVRVSGFNGYGIKFDSIHDSLVENISIEHCGNSTCHAFWVGSSTDTSNHTVFNRVQIEQAHTCSMYVAMSTLCCTFENIHSERVHEISQDIYTHTLLGGCCSYLNGRIENSAADELLRPRLLLGGSTNVYEAILTDASVTKISSTDRRWGFFNNCNLRNVVHSEIATAKFHNCRLSGLHVSSETCHFEGCQITNLTLGYSVDAYKYFINCNIEDIGYDAAFYRGIFTNCEFSTSTADATTKLSPMCTYDNCVFNCVTRVAFDVKIVVQNSFISTFRLQGANAQVTLLNNRITEFTREMGINNKLTWINNIYSGEVVKDNANDVIILAANAPEVPTILIMTEAEYLALEQVDANTIYLIKG